MRQLLLSALLLMSVSVVADRTAPTAVSKLKVGDSAPDFTLKDQSGRDMSLHQFRGKTVVLAFYVFAFTGG